MQKVSYMGNGTTTEFYFDFPYFEASNVVVTKNGAPVTGCNIIGNSGGPDADISYIGGKVVFEVAPTSLDCITIARQLPLTRIADYQPIARINPTTLNQDLNYLMEVIKDRKDELSDLMTKYEEIADKEILARISAIREEITDIDAKITALGDISTLRISVETNTENITTLSTGKANCDMDNLSDIGKNTIATASMPSGNFVNITVGASGASYTAPADGYFCAYAKTTAAGGWVMLITPNSGPVNKSLDTAAGGYVGCTIPASAGQAVNLLYAGVTFDYFVFCCANIPA